MTFNSITVEESFNLVSIEVRMYGVLCVVYMCIVQIRVNMSMSSRVYHFSAVKTFRILSCKCSEMDGTWSLLVVTLLGLHLPT